MNKNITKKPVKKQIKTNKVTIEEAIYKVYEVFRDTTDTKSEEHAKIMFMETFLSIWLKRNKR